jgi:hypothetical protein
MNDMADTPLNEDEVVAAVARKLVDDGWTIASIATTKQHGYDVVAEREGQRLIVEAKGAIAARPDAAPFTTNMCRQSVEAALYKIARAESDGAGTDFAIAVPDTSGYRTAIDRIAPFLARMSVRVMLVDSLGATDYADRG